MTVSRALLTHDLSPSRDGTVHQASHPSFCAMLLETEATVKYERRRHVMQYYLPIFRSILEVVCHTGQAASPEGSPCGLIVSPRGRPLA